MSFKYISIAAFLALSSTLYAQRSGGLSFPEGQRCATVLLPSNAVHIDSNGGSAYLPVLSNVEYTLEAVWQEGETPWFTVEKKNGRWHLRSDYWYRTEPREGKVLVRFAEGGTQEVSVVQNANLSMFSSLNGEMDVPVEVAVASSENSKQENIQKSYDGILSTYYLSHKSKQLPVTLTYELAYPSHLDYMVYTPRLDQAVGRWGTVTVACELVDAPGEYVDVVKDYDCQFSKNPIRIDFGEKGIDLVNKVRITVTTGKENRASCSEINFYRYNPLANCDYPEIFTDGLCSALRPGVTDADLAQVANPVVRQLGYYLLSGNYDTAYRVAEFEPYETLQTLRTRLKTGNYNRYENPTGIYFEKGKRQIIFAEGIDERYPVNLIVKDFGRNGNQPEHAYPLKNGMNNIDVLDNGNGYVSYYTDDYKTAGNVRLHFALAKVNGYFDLERGDSNEDWKKLLANACSDILDVRTQNLQVAFPLARFKENCPDDGVGLAQLYDSVVYYERDVMGLSKYGVNPKNRQFARVIWDGFMFADDVGAAIVDGSVPIMTTTDRSRFGFWGLGHELGHVNQVRPGLKWAGLCETSNNIYSAWVQQKLSRGIDNWEFTMDGVDDYRHLWGGRFNCYLEDGVRRGTSWLMQRGPDFGPPTKSVTIANEDYEGRPTGKDTTLLSGPSDHFVKLAPLWQLQVYCQMAGFSPDIYAKVCQSVRTTDESKMSSGQLQIKFMRVVCDSSKMNFLPFFEKAGMLKPICELMDDYGYSWLKINQKMVDDLKAYIATKNYPTPKGELNYITSLNYKCYVDELPVEGGLNSGCTPVQNFGNTYIKIDHRVWKNAVAYETYDKDGNLLRISMCGLGAPKHSHAPYTLALWPQTSKEKAAYVMAVSWDGKRIKCYER